MKLAEDIARSISDDLGRRLADALEPLVRMVVRAVIDGVAEETVHAPPPPAAEPVPDVPDVPIAEPPPPPATPARTETRQRVCSICGGPHYANNLKFHPIARSPRTITDGEIDEVFARAPAIIREVESSIDHIPRLAPTRITQNHRPVVTKPPRELPEDVLARREWGRARKAGTIGVLPTPSFSIRF